MSQHHIRRALSHGARVDDPTQPDEVRCEIAIRILGQAFEAVRQRGLGAVGIDQQTRLALQGMKSLSRSQSSCTDDTHTAFAAIPLDLMHEAIIAGTLPNQDREILTKLRDSSVHATEAVERADRRLREKLQWSTITIERGKIRLRNRVGSVEIETSAPALVDDTEHPTDGIAFALPFHILWELFDRTRGALLSRRFDETHRRGSFKWSEELERKQIIFLDYRTASRTLRIHYGTARISCIVEPLILPEPPLANLAKDEERRPLSARGLASGIDWMQRLPFTSNVVQSDAKIISTGSMTQISFADDDVGDETMIILNDVATTLRSVLRRFHPGCTSRTNGDHNLLEKGIATTVFPCAKNDVRDYDAVEAAIKCSGHSLSLMAVDLATAFVTARAIGTKSVCLQILPGLFPQLKMFADNEGNNGRSSMVTYMALCTNDVKMPADRAIAIDVERWKNLVVAGEGIVVDILVSADCTGALIAHRSAQREIRALVPVEAAECQRHEWDERMVSVDGKHSPSQKNSADVADLMVEVSNQISPASEFALRIGHPSGAIEEPE